MKNLFLLSIIFSLVFSQAYADRETRSLQDFDKVVLGIAGTLFLQQGSKHEIELEGTTDQLERLETKVVGNTLHISLKKSFRNFNSRDLTMNLTLKELEGLTISGSGKVVSRNQLITNQDLKIVLSGSGFAELDIDGKNIKSLISGSGKLMLAGIVEAHQVSISGSGSLRALDMQTNNYDIRISGSGSCRINVVEKVNANISGSGTIYYTGSPNQIESSVSGSGKIKKVS